MTTNTKTNKKTDTKTVTTNYLNELLAEVERRRHRYGSMCDRLARNAAEEAARVARGVLPMTTCSGKPMLDANEVHEAFVDFQKAQAAYLAAVRLISSVLP